MICSNCGKQLPENSLFCPSCGTKVESKKAKKKFELNKNQKIITLVLMSIFLVMLGLLAFLPGSSNTRTIMIYVVGSNLETNNHIVSADLESIDIKKIDLSKTNILLYTGGTEKWHNFISNTENGIYILKNKGFEKLVSEKQLNLGDPNTLAKFLKYGYDNYKTDKYDLILYDHGGAIDGAIYDDISGDHLTLDDMSMALKNSPFNENNKLEAILFRTCLNGTIELANIYKPYAKFLIGSEEISWGSPMTSVLNFINDLEPSDSGKEFGIKFVKAYEEQMKIINSYGDQPYTYSVIDLSKMDKINTLLDEYIKSIDVTKNYKDLSRIRASMYQYGSDNPTYDMIDLYEFVNNTEQYASVDNTKLMNAISDAIVYNNSNNSSSHGLSIYFPYSGRKGSQMQYLSVYEKLNYSNSYLNFIKTFNTIKSSPSSFSFNVQNNEIKKEDTTKSVSIQLTKEQMENYAYATFAIFEQDKEHPNYYWVLLSSDDVELSKDGLLTANYENSLVKLIDEDDGKEKYMLTFYRKHYNNARKANTILYNTDKSFSDEGFMTSAELYISKDKNGKPKISSLKKVSNNEHLDGILLNINDYHKYELWQTEYRIMDANGNIINSDEWEMPPVRYGYAGTVSKLNNSLKYTNLDKGDNYYALFFITNVDNEKIYSKLIKVGE